MKRSYYIALAVGVLLIVTSVAVGLSLAGSSTARSAPLQAKAAPVTGSTTTSQAPSVAQQPTQSRAAAAQKPAAAKTTAAQTGVQKTSSTTTATAPALNLDALPLGDGKVSTSPKVGYVYSCLQQFKPPAGPSLPWIHGSTWNLTQKISVQGHVLWPSAQFSNVVQGTERILSGNGLPVGEPTGNFPIARSDPAYRYDKNPNHIQAQSDSFTLPLHPTFASAPSCVPMGIVGMALDGVAIYNALDASGRDAAAHEVQDSCHGHPDSSGEYHYHGPSPCMPNVNARNTVVGYALDGFPITSLYNAKGQLYTNAELDACHGTTSPIIENGKTVTTYHYVLTEEYPYSIGCFRGTPVRTGRSPGARPPRP